MSIKDLFNNKGTPKIQKSATTEDLVDQVESSEFVEAKRKQFDQFIPPIDFASASNFAKFGSAELYYEKAFERIYQYYPYDGTLHEKVEFENSSSYLDKYVFENLYPRTNGYVNFDSSTYITIFGGPHTASSGMIGKTLDSTFDYSMKYDEEKKRTSAFEYRGEDGITAEFWLKVPDTSSARTIFHISGATGDIKLHLDTSDQFMMSVNSGSSTSVSETLMTSSTNGTDWNHFVFTMQSGSEGTTFKSYKNGQLVFQKTGTGANYNIPSILPTTDGQNMWLGSNATEAQKLSGSLDDFRFWKTARTPEDIFNTWFIPVGGGTNKHDANVDLSLYLKFNEGITGTEALDKIALDYSGRINNGTIVGYSSGFRSTGSAITEKLGEPEFKDPIIYSTHPDVVSKKAEYKTSGSLADLENTSMFYRYFPGWMQEEDEQNGKQLKYLSQVLGSYLDTLWHQISFVNKIHDHHYISGSNKSLPFAKKLLYDQGFVIPDLFVDATKIENLRQKDDNEVFEKEINEVRNTIYHNIYNNLNAIYKSKGTEKSFRNFFRSIGIGQDVVKLRMYADDSTFVLRNNYEHKSYERKFVDFNVNGHFDATLFQTSSANNSNIYIPGDSSYTGSFTLQSEVILPRKQRKNEVDYNPFPYLSSSIMGYLDGDDYTSATDGLQVFVVHSALESSLDNNDKQRVKFILTGSSINLESDWFWGQYENNKWSLAVRMKHSTYPRPNITGSTPDDYLVEFYGVEADGNTERNSFSLSTSSVGQTYYSSDKIFYAGAHKTNFSGSTLHYSDVKLGYVRYWHSYLSNDAIKQHAFDSETFGANEPFEQDLVNVYPVEIPREKTLAFHWAFNDLTGSDSSGEFLVSDLSSGSSNSDYSSLSDTIQRYVAAKGFGFNASSSKVLDKNYLYSARKRLPDDLMSSDLTTIKTDETEQFFVDDDVSDNFYSFEKSMWGAISDEMMNMFSTALDLNNLIGQPNQRYHHKYGMAEFLRDRFFDDVENEPDIQKFTSFYKWIDDSISIALQQLTPASARFAEKINNIIESHVLERNKYIHQIPITTNFESTEGSIKGVSEMKYNWQYGHAPTDTSNEGNNVLWHQDRSQKEGLRETLRNSKNNHSIQSSGLTRREIDGTARISDTYAVRKFAKTYDVGIVSQNTIHGGTNFGRKKNLQLFHESVSPAGTTGASGEPENIITVGVGTGQAIVETPTNNDSQPTKKKYQVDAKVGNQYGNEYGHDILGDFIIPMNVMSGTINSGFNAEVHSKYKQGVHFTNLHNDVVGNYNETSIQGPFTEQHVGGLQYRHVDITEDVEASGSRPEGWGLLLKDHPYLGPDADGAFGFVGADYQAPYPGSGPKAARYRDEHAKRPVNLRNIKTVSGSWKAGNYKNELEIFQISPTFQKTWAVEAYDDPNVDILPPFISNALPDTTHYQTLMGFAGYVSGNYFGSTNNNRQFDGGIVVSAIAGTSADGTFELTGSPNPAITASGSFDVLGTEVEGTFASGSFDVTGATIQEAFASGSFEVTAANVQGTQAVGSFTMTSSFVPGVAPSNSTFDVLGINDVEEGSIMVITQSGIAPYSYEVDLDNSLTDPGHTSISGSTDRNFWNDLQASISSDLPDYTVSYVEHPVTRSIALSSSNNTNSRLYSETITNGGGGTAGYAISFWLYFDTFGTDQQKTIYESMDSTNPLDPAVSKYIFIESGSMVFESYWYDNAGSGDYFVDTWTIPNLTSSYSQSLNHFSFSHSGSHGQGDQLILYINGVSSSALSVDSLAQHKGVATPGSTPYVDAATTHITLFTKNDGNNPLFRAGSTGPIYLDEVVVYPESRNHSDMTELHNGGKWQNTKPGSPFAIYDFEELTVGTALTNLQEVEDASGNSNHLTASINTAGDLVPLTGSGDSLTIVKTPSSASFTLSGAPVGSNYNLTINLEGPLSSFFSITGSSDGVDNEGAIDGSTLSVDGTTFTIIHTGTPSALEVLATGSSVTDASMWTSMKDKIEANTSYTVTTGSDNPRTFNLTSTSTGSAEDPSLSTNAATFNITNAGTAGTDESGAEDGDSITIDGSTFVIDITSGIGTGSTGDFHNALSQSIKDNTDFDTIAVTDLGNGFHKFSLTSSVSGVAKNVAFTQNTNGSRTTFQNLDGAAGGVDAAGAESGDIIYLGATSFQITDGVPAVGVVSSTGSTTDFHNALSQSIKDNTAYDDITITNLGTGYYRFNLTSSLTGSSYNQTITQNTNGSRTTFQNLISLAGGTDEAGAEAGDELSIGPQTFTIVDGAPANSFEISTTGSDSQFHNALSQSIKDNTNFDTITITDLGNGYHRFDITSSAVGALGNATLSQNSNGVRDTFDNFVQTNNGVNASGIVDGDELTIGSLTFVLTESSPGDSSPTFYVETTGASTQIWASLESKIESNGYSATITDNGDYALFEITSSATGSAQNVAMSGDSPSFSNVDATLLNGTDYVPPVYSVLDNVIQIPRTDLTGSQRNITTRFSAPGGPEIQTYGYLDAYTSTYSVHNALPYRNSSVLGSGSGEEGTIRVEDHLGLRRGLRTLRALHTGKFGIDSQYGEITEGTYPSSGSFNKQHRNTSQRMEYSGSSIITGSNYDNAFINTPIPRSELQYSWIHNATSGSHWYAENDAPSQRILGYAPRDGIVSSSVGFVEAIVFPSASSIFGS